MLPPFEGEQHVYRPTLGEGVFQIPVGPVHAGIIEPGHFNFAVAGEPILYLQLRMFYTHKGTEKLFEQLPVPQAVFLAESVSGRFRFLARHGVLPGRGESGGDRSSRFAPQVMRTILLELERIYNHIADIGAIAMDVGFVIANAHAGRVREMVLALNEELTGSRLLRGMVCIGGVRPDWDGGQIATLRSALDAVEREFRRPGGADQVLRFDPRPAGAHRRAAPGEGPRRWASSAWAGAPPASTWTCGATIPTPPTGIFPGACRSTRRATCWHRMQVRIDEVRESIAIIRAAADNLPGGPHRAEPRPIPAGRCALSAVEGWRGEILHWVRTGPGNRLERCKIKDPSLNNWPALVEAVQGNIIADFPVINKSFNLSYSGTDR